MALLLLIVFFALFLAFLYLLFKNVDFPDVPGPPFHDYLPNGLAYNILKDRLQFINVLSRLSDKYGDIFHVWIGPRRIIVTSVPADIVQIMTNVRDFGRLDSVTAVFEETVPGSLFTMPHKPHHATRLKMRSHFNFSMLSDFHTPMLAAVNELISDLTAVAKNADPGHMSSIVDMNDMLTAMTFRVILNVALGSSLSREERIRFAESMRGLTVAMAPQIMLYPVVKWLSCLGVRKTFFKHRDYVTDVIQKILQERLSESNVQKAGRTPDFLDAMLDNEIGDIKSITSNAVFITLAGSYTTSLTIAWSLFYVCQDERILAKIEAEIDSIKGSSDEAFTHEDIPKLVYLKKIWKETLRLSPPTGLTTRKALRDLTLKGSGLKVKKGTRLNAFFVKCQLNERYWVEADQFIPERWGSAEDPGEGDKVCAGAYLPFALGMRNCLGQFLADYEGVLILAELFRRFTFTLGCKREEVVTVCAVLQMGRYSSKKDGNLDMGIPMRVALRGESPRSDLAC